jgi:TonB family protein
MVNPGASAAQAGPGTASSPPGAYRIGGGVSAPHVVSKSEPEYSEEAREARLEGTVTLSLVVDASGVPRNLRVLKGLGLGLDEKALKAVAEWRFLAGKKEGNPVPILATIQINFQLLGPEGRWHLIRVAFDPPKDVSLPSVAKSRFPRDSRASNPGSVTLTLDVDEHGKPVNFHVEKSSDPDSEHEVIAAMREWRFNPAMKDGMSISVPLTLEFSQIVTAPAPPLPPAAAK